MYPEARMIDAMKVWKLPAGKESMLSEMCQNGQYFLEEKIDGYWYEYEKTQNYSYLFSRNESKVTGGLSEKSANVPHIMEALDCLPADTILIGEIYYPGGTSKTVTSIMGCLPELAISRQKDKPIHYYVHDMIFYEGVNLINTGAEDRYNLLEAIWKFHNLDKYDFLRLANKVDENLEEEISRILKSGGEGAVLKKRNYPYTPGKRPAWSTIKIKQMDNVDLICIGFCPPTKEYTGKEIESWPYWLIQKKDINFPSGDWIEVKKLDHYEAIRGINYRTIPITKYYYYGWPSAIEIGAYDDEGNIKYIGTVSSGLTDEDKQGMAERPNDYLNKVVSLDCMSINKKDNTLRHPVLKYWREDKSAKDCLITEIFGQ